MKQTLLMIILTVIGTAGVVVGGPFVAVAVYYLFAVLRPQALWAWALPPGAGWSQFPAFAAMLGLVLYTFGIVPIGARRREVRPAFPRTGWLYLGFTLWILGTYFTALDRDVAWPWIVEYLKIFAMLFVSMLIIRTLGQVWILYLISTLALIYIAYEMNSLYLFDRRLDIYRNGYGGLDNNGAGLMLAMAIPLAIGAWEGANGLWRWGFLFSIPPLIHAVLISYSRGAMVSLLVATPVVLWKSRFRLQMAALSLCLALVVPVLAGPQIRTRFFSVAQYNDDQSANSRFSSWRAAIRIANDYPIAGVGVRNANLLSSQYGADVEGRTIHSQYLQILADTGYVGLFLYLAAAASVFTGLVRARAAARARTDAAARRCNAMANGIEGALLVFAVGSAFLSLEVFELPYVLALIGAQLAVVSLPDVQAPASLRFARAEPSRVGTRPAWGASNPRPRGASAR